jgi:hypothetical protein
MTQEGQLLDGDFPLLTIVHAHPLTNYIKCSRVVREEKGVKERVPFFTGMSSITAHVSVYQNLSCQVMMHSKHLSHVYNLANTFLQLTQKLTLCVDIKDAVWLSHVHTPDLQSLRNCWDFTPASGFELRLQCKKFATVTELLAA